MKKFIIAAAAVLLFANNGFCVPQLKIKYTMDANVTKHDEPIEIEFRHIVAFKEKGKPDKVTRGQWIKLAVKIAASGEIDVPMPSMKPGEDVNEIEVVLVAKPEPSGAHVEVVKSKGGAKGAEPKKFLVYHEEVKKESPLFIKHNEAIHFHGQILPEMVISLTDK